MNEFVGRVAVVTGGASGIGFGLAEKFASVGMKVVLADIAQDDLDRAVAHLRTGDRDVIGVVTDVSKEEQVNELAAATLATHGAVHILCNNAGVATTQSNLWKCSVKDYEWVLGVNLWGVIWGIRAFVPVMLEQDTDCHIVNTSSMAGVLTAGGIYGIAKHGVCSLSESLYLSLQRRNARIGVSVLLPGITSTNLDDAARHRPPDLSDPHATPTRPSERRGSNALAAGQSPSLVAEKTFDCIRNGRFWIVPNEKYRRPVVERAAGMFNGENPVDVQASMPGFGQPGEGW